MYSNRSYGHSSSPTPAELSNNPFISDPTSAHSRYPDISSPPTSYPQYTQWLQSQPQSPSYQGQQQLGSLSQLQPQMTSYYPQQQQQPAQTGFQPSSAFGQQLVTQVNTGYFPQQQQYTGYPAQQQQQQPYGGYPQQQQGPSYADLAQFDPYASISQGWDPSQQQQSQSQVQSSAAPPGQAHPRDYIRTHKAELEAWDAYAWKQLINAFEALQGAWDVRRREVKARQAAVGGGGYGGYGGGYGEAERLQGLLKEADLNFDSVAASSFQMHEVRQGYRQSGDLASKRRVRESCNAALQSLPEWPPQAW